FLNTTSQGSQTSGFSWVITLTNGTNNLTIVGYDDLGNPSQNIQFIILDLTIPNLTILSPTISLTNQSQQIVSVDTNAQSAVLLQDGISQGSLSSGFSWSITLQEGMNNLTIMAYAASGSFAIDTLLLSLDSIAPSLSINGVENDGIYSDSVDIQVITEDGGGVAYTELWFENQLLVNQSSSSFNYTLDTTTRFDGAHVLIVISYDLAGNKYSITLTIWINNSSDQTAPSVTVSGISNGQIYDDILTITITASDSSGINRAELYLDDELFDIDSEYPYQFILDIFS
ncbi:unnamed protein product, partial [marine sediment metagenome]